MWRRALAPIASLLVLSCGGQPASSPLSMDPRGEGAGFTIRMHRDAEVGDRYRLTERWELERTTTIRRGDSVALEEEQHRSAILDADVLVLAVTPEGKELERRYTVRSFRYLWNGVPGAPIPAGSIIRVIAARDGRGVIEWNGDEPLPPDASAALRAVVHTVVRPGTEDEMFGTAEAQPIGGRWRIDSARASSDLSAVPGLRVAPGGVSGESVLVEATQEAGIDCLKIETTMEAEVSEMPPPREGAVVEEARFDVRIRGLYPLERGLPQIAAMRRTRFYARGRIEPPPSDGAERAEGEAPPATDTFEMEATTTARRRVIPQ